MRLTSELFFIFVLIFTSLNFSQEKINTKEHPDWSYNQTIYEVNVRQFSPEGTFAAVEKELPRLKELGIGIIWLMPIHPIGEKNRKGSLGSYYSVKDYFGINPEFGTLDDFKSLVNKTHQLGMYLIIDWVANHTAWDNKMIEEHPDWYTKDSSGNFVPPVADWADVVDLNYDNNELRRYMISAMQYWVEECNIDGFRCDVAGMVPLDFWKEASAELQKIKNVFMLAEDENPGIHSAFDMTYSWELFKTMNAIAAGEKNANDLVNLLNEERKKFPADAFRMRFTSNHDENTWNGTVYERLGNAAETFAALTVIIPGMPLIYNGQEAGLDKRLKFFEKDTIQWRDHKFQNIYSTLFNLKKQNEVLHNGTRGGSLQFLPSSENVLCILREKNENRILSIFNLSDKSEKIELSSNSVNGSYKDLFSGKKIELTGKSKLELKPWEYLILVKE